MKRRFTIHGAAVPPPEDLDRRSRLVRAGHAVIPDNAGLMAYLNTPDAELGGSPLDVGTSSELGLELVELALAKKALRNGAETGKRPGMDA